MPPIARTATASCERAGIFEQQLRAAEQQPIGSRGDRPARPRRSRRCSRRRGRRRRRARRRARGDRRLRVTRTARRRPRARTRPSWRTRTSSSSVSSGSGRWSRVWKPISNPACASAPHLRSSQAVRGRVVADQLPTAPSGYGGARPPRAAARRPRRGRRTTARRGRAGPAARAAGRGSRPRSAAACRRCHQKRVRSVEPRSGQEEGRRAGEAPEQRRRHVEMAREVVIEGDRDRNPPAAAASEHRAVKPRRRHQFVRASQVTQMPLERGRGDPRHDLLLPTAATRKSGGRRAHRRRWPTTCAPASAGPTPASGATPHRGGAARADSGTGPGPGRRSPGGEPTISALSRRCDARLVEVAPPRGADRPRRAVGEARARARRRSDGCGERGRVVRRRPGGRSPRRRRRRGCSPCAPRPRAS